MGWETRKGRRYYYHKERTGGQVRSRYIRSREIAAGLAALAGVDQQLTALARLQEKQDRAAAEAGDALLTDLESALSLITRAVLLTNGYHQHKGTWRKKRAQISPSTSAGDRGGTRPPGPDGRDHAATNPSAE